ncbi:PRC-barrel domain-containing protein [Tropicimonas isoalkanivorans]|uniref:PRC-barrel domain-containing protein n=2 Tax=Tropicimonas isoalkanivorans TaxID=441112 RepID=A0A1I1RAE2_9RHOB|nr:PRC-barrel domain-containing protein [Tropicimonas isoalkanivorans]
MKHLILSTMIAAGAVAPAFAQNDEVRPLFWNALGASHVSASSMLGLPVFRDDHSDQTSDDGAQPDWDEIGSVEDVILSTEGQFDALVVELRQSAGGDHKTVAVAAEVVQFVFDGTAPGDQDVRVVLNLPEGALNDAPAFNGAEAGSADLTSPLLGTTLANGDLNASSTQVSDGVLTAPDTELTTERLTGAPVFDSNDMRVGEISELLLNDAGEVQAAIVDTGGFLGLGETPVKIELNDMQIDKPDNSISVRVYLSMTEEELASFPHYDG